MIRILLCALSLAAGTTVVQAQPTKPPTPKDGPLGMKFVPLPKGTTYLGWNGEKGSAKKTEIKEDFEIAIHTVTQGQWQELMGDNPSWCSRKGGGKEKAKDIKDEDLKQFPVENVSWNDAQEFIKKLNEKEKGTGYAYRLPTEAEWEYACRGGATMEAECSYHFYFAKPTNDLSSTQANFYGNNPSGKGEKGPYLGRTTKVGSYAPNKLGLYDMHGNVWQWTDSFFFSQQGSVRVIRGGSWLLGGQGCQAASRNGLTPTGRNGNLGFRLVRAAIKEQPDKPAPEAPKAKDGPLGMKFVPLPKGTTYLGWNGTKGSAKKTEIKEDFEIAIHTVTQGQWTELMGRNPSLFSRDGKAKHMVKDVKDEDLNQFPVETVFPGEAEFFIKKLNEKETGKGYVYRLPTSAEWEYACRGGATAEEECSHYFYSDKPTNSLSSKQANIIGKGEEEPRLARPTKVGSYAPNKLGLYDMHGNVWQLTGTIGVGGNITRGGSYDALAVRCRADYRESVGLNSRSSHIGFRLVRVAVKEPLAKPTSKDGPLAKAESLAGKRVIFLGDSNTQAGGYVNFTTYYLEKLYPKLDFDIVGLGLASETLSGLSEDGHAGGKFPRPCLFERLDRVLEKAKPEVVFACYGMNDGIYLPLDKDRTAAFQKGVTKLIEQCQKAGAKQVFLITPPIYDFMPKKGEFNYDTVLTEYAKWEMGLKIDGVTVIDLHTPMRKARDARAEPFSKDKVHPGDDGHLLMAQTILATLGTKAPDEKLTDIKADPLFKLVAQKRALRSSAWMKHIGYTREKTVQPGPLGTAEADAAKLQEQIDALRRKIPLMLHPVGGGHLDEVQAVAFSPDGKLLASASSDGTIRLWETAAGSCQGILKLPDSHVESFHHDWLTGQTTRSSQSEDRLSFSSLAFSPDGRFLASGEWRLGAVLPTTAVRLWDVANCRLIASQQKHSDGVHSVAFSPDGKTLVSAGGARKNTIQLWDMTAGKLLDTLDGNEEDVYSVRFAAFSPDGKRLVSVANRTINIWDLAKRSNTRIKTTASHTQRPPELQAALHPDGMSVSISEHKTVRILTLPTGKEIHVLKGAGEVMALAYSPDGSILASALFGKLIQFWDPKTGKELATLKCPQEVRSLSFSGDGKQVASGGADGSVHLWDTSTRKILRQIPESLRFAALAFSGDGRILAAGTFKGFQCKEPGTVRLWDVSTGRSLAALDSQTNWVRSLAFSPESNVLAWSGWKLSLNKTLLWEITNRKHGPSFQGFSPIAFSPVGQLLATRDEDGAVRLWNPRSGKEVGVLKKPLLDGHALSFSPDGKLLAGISAGTVVVWDVENQKLQRVLDKHGGVNTLAFSPDGKLLAAGDKDATIQLWDTRTWEPTSLLKVAFEGGLAPTVESLVFSPNSKTLFSGHDNDIQIWDVATGKTTIILKAWSPQKGSAGVTHLAISPNGRILAATAWGAPEVMLWDLAPKSSDPAAKAVEK